MPLGGSVVQCGKHQPLVGLDLASEAGTTLPGDVPLACPLVSPGLSVLISKMGINVAM